MQQDKNVIKVLFICLGNICRSPMAEYVFKDIVKKENNNYTYIVDSRATSSSEVGNGMHRGTLNKLIENKIEYDKHIAKKLKKEDYDNYDYIIGMDKNNILDIYKIFNIKTSNKISRLLDFTNESRDISDPWYTGDFDTTYNDILTGCKALFEKIDNSTNN